MMPEKERTIEEEIIRDYHIKKAMGQDVPLYHKVLKQAKLQAVVEVLIEALKEDTSRGSYYSSWRESIAASIIKEYEITPDVFKTDIRTIASAAAQNFLNQLIK